MTEALLPWYDRELEHFRQMAAEFAARYPKVAARLSLESHGTKDPHVERMVQAFAFLNARIRYKLDDEFPEIADAMLGILYPHFLSPIPSMSVVDFQLKKGQADLPAGHLIPAGTYLESEAVDDEKCLFRTCYPVRLWPFQFNSVALESRPFPTPETSRSSQAVAQFRIELQLADQTKRFRDMAPGSLRFYLHGQHLQHLCQLYEFLSNDAIEVVLASSPTDNDPVVLPRNSIHGVGFDRNEAVLPNLARTFPGYRLLTEFFTFPRKFLFLELTGLTASALQKIGSTLWIFVTLKKTDKDLERLVNKEMVRFGSTPIVNLFPLTADPIDLTHRSTEYRIVPDARREKALEVYSVENVGMTDRHGETIPIRPFYSISHADQSAKRPIYWHAMRRPGPVNRERYGASGSEMYLSIVDPHFSPMQAAQNTLQIETTCFNRDLPGRLPTGGNRPAFALRTGDEKLGPIQCLVPPTQTIRQDYRHSNLWKLISHLSLNHLSISSGAEGVQALKEILKLYNITRSVETEEMIDGLVGIEKRPSVARIAGSPSGFCRGIDVELSLNAEKFTGHGAYLFGAVLERFLGLYVNLNSFTRVSVRKRRPHGPAETWTWPPRAGDRTLL